jgi:hypothetical protein
MAVISQELGGDNKLVLQVVPPSLVEYKRQRLPLQYDIAGYSKGIARRTLGRSFNAWVLARACSYLQLVYSMCTTTVPYCTSAVPVKIREGAGGKT